MNLNKITILFKNDRISGLKFSFSLIFVFVSIFVFGQETTGIDSLQLSNSEISNSVNDSIPNDSIDSDTVTTAKIKKLSPDALNYNVTYSSKDSMLFDMSTGKMYLHGEAKLTGEDMDLSSEYVEVNTKENYLFAEGVKNDSTGVVKGMPKIKDGSDEFRAKSIKYNFNSKKGIIYDVVTEYSEGFIHGNKTKRHPNNEIHILDGKYTTCNLDHPHFYIKLTKAKVIPGEKVVAGPMYFVIADIPLKIIGLPFGYIPSQKKNTSGFIIPQYGQEERRGFFLREGGYFWAINDYKNVALTFDTYTQGSWGVKMQSNFKKRYRYSGNLSVEYNKNRFGEKILPEYSETTTFWVKGSYKQDAKANPYSNFSVALNFGSSGHNASVAKDIEQLTNNTTSSNISYRRKVPGSQFNFTANISSVQNTKTEIMNLKAPTMSLNMTRQYPFKMISKSGTSHWYDKISVGFTSSMRNSLTSPDSLVFTQQSIYKMENGLKYNVPVSGSFTVLDHFNFSPSFTYNGRLYSNYINKRAIYMPNEEDSLVQTVTTDTLSGFRHPFDFSFSAPLSTKLYGTFNFKGNLVKAFRHVVSPSVSFNYRPDFGKESWNYYGDYYTEQDTVLYSYFGNGIFGSPPKGKSGNISFSLGNNFEMKVRNRKDTITGEKKIALLKRLNFGASYNLAADSMNWSNLRITGNTKLHKNVSLNFNATYDPYARDSSGVRINTFEWEQNKQLLRLKNASLSMTGSLKPQDFNSKEKEKSVLSGNEYYPYGFADVPYTDFDVPWNLSMNYRIGVNNKYSSITQDYSKEIKQTVNLSGNFSLTKKWSVSSRLDYDITAKKFVYSSVGINRDLHCWAMSITIVPFGQLKSYMFRIYIKSSIFDGVEYKKEKSKYDYQ